MTGPQDIRMLNESAWDFVVLQEQSTLPIKNPKRTHENIRDFHALIDRTDARTILYMTWARLNAPETQAVLSSTYDDIGAELGVTVVPAGLAWQHVLSTEPAPTLHDADNSHPTLAGSYLAACTFQWTLFGAPVGEPEAAAEIAAPRRALARRSIIRCRFTSSPVSRHLATKKALCPRRNVPPTKFSAYRSFRR